MRLPWLLGSLMVVLLFTGCAGPDNRNAVLYQLNAAPMTASAWASARGTYNGPIHASTDRFGFHALMQAETRLDLYGSASDPAVTLQVDKGYSTAWTMYGERTGTYTNVPTKRYGSQGTILATSHYPNQVLLVVRRDTTVNHKPTWLILTFLPNGSIDIDYLGLSGWRGSGELWRIPG
jgi:hypothetical protein